MPYNFAAESFHTKKLLADFHREKPNILYEKRSLHVSEAPFRGLGATYAVHLRLIGKLIVDFLLGIIELFR